MDSIVTEPKDVTSLTRTYSKLGWVGFWLQLVVGSVPVLLMAYLFVFARVPGPRAGFAFVEYLSLASLSALVFTTFWAFRYTRLGLKLAAPEKFVTYKRLMRAAWIGVVVSTVGMLFSMLIMFIEVAHLLFYFLSTPQGGVPVIQTVQAETASWVSAVDMLSLLALVLTLFAELAFLSISQVCLFRASAAASATTGKVVTMAGDAQAD
jgi:hypothetical protein